MACNLKFLCVYLILAHAAAAASVGAPVSIAIYWGQNAKEGSLAKTCGTGRYALVIMAFLCEFGSGRTPQLNFADHCNATRGDCAGLREDIISCQSDGVKVLLSIGGLIGHYSLSSTSDAQGVATYLWDAFLGGGAAAVSRPFGDAVLDGIDINIICHSSNYYYDVLAEKLTSLYAGDVRRRRYLLTAAPQCPFPDASLSPALDTGLFDHVWVQFYNNPVCQYAPGNASNLWRAWEQWTRALPSASLFLGLPASPDAAIGYIDPQTLVSRVLPLVNGSANYGGILLWSRNYDLATGYSLKLLGNADPPNSYGSAPRNGSVSENIGPSRKKSVRIYIVAGTLGLFGVCVILLTVFLWYKRWYGMMPWQRGPKIAPRLESFLQKQGTTHPKRYTYYQVKRMTKSFAHKLGQGGYGAVFRGSLPDGREIAVKMLKDTEGDGEVLGVGIRRATPPNHVFPKVPFNIFIKD